jgi:glutamine cyclotransferase
MRTFLVTAAVAVALGCVAFLALSSSCSGKGKVTRPPDGNDTIPPQVSVVSPNGGETLFEGFAATIRWVATDNVGVDSISLFYSTDGGSTYPHWIAGGEANDSTYVWSVPHTPSAGCRVRVVAYDRGLNQTSDASDDVFHIAPLDTIPSDTTVVYGFRLINAYPHDRNAFTQGLVFESGTLFEGTGHTGTSTIRRVDLETGNVLQSRALLGLYFGEGIDVRQDKLYQLTWTSRIGFIYDRATFDSLGPFYYPHEGWGITHDDTRFIVSDGTPRLRFWDLSTLAPTDSVDVYQVVGGSRLSVKRLNELEYIDGKVYANVWLSDLIAIICPQTGKVEAWIKLTDLVARERAIYAGIDVLNGIAYDEVSGRLFVTGKYWPELLEIEVVQN